jgi:hypothetical protein
VSQQQRDAVDQLLRDAPLDLGGDVAEQRVIFKPTPRSLPRASERPADRARDERSGRREGVSRDAALTRANRAKEQCPPARVA